MKILQLQVSALFLAIKGKLLVWMEGEARLLCKACFSISTPSKVRPRSSPSPQPTSPLEGVGLQREWEQ